jgi:diguanylate cyclase (GGDEF)-like protein/PAS domain S-box-containing protein
LVLLAAKQRGYLDINLDGELFVSVGGPREEKLDLAALTVNTFPNRIFRRISLRTAVSRLQPFEPITYALALLKRHTPMLADQPFANQAPGPGGVSEDSFQLLFDANPVSMWIWDHETYRFLAVNDTAIARYGFSREQFLSMRLFELKPPEDHGGIREIARGTGGYQENRVSRHIKADGGLIDVAIFGRSLNYRGRSASLVAAVDITARKRAEDEVRSTREFLSAVIENVLVSIFVKDAVDLRYVLVNRAAEEYLGLPRDEIIGKTAHDIFPGSTADAVFVRDRDQLERKGCGTLEGYEVETPRNGIRAANSKRLTIRGVDGQPQYLLVMTEDVTEKLKAEAQIKHLAHHDPLTNLPNRASFNAHLAEAIDRAAATGGSFAALCIDLDRFKEINDVFGHSVGDGLLCQVSARMREIAGNALIARLGGDEFTIILQGSDQPESAAIFADRLLEAMSPEFEIEGQRLRAGLSIGIAVYPGDGIAAAALLSNADAALYRAKEDGRGTIRFFEAEMDKRLRERHAIQQDLQSAIARGELELHYQPQAAIGGGIIGFEALLRWHHPSRGLIPPMTFIPIAEESGLIVQIGEWVLREACREAATWPIQLRVAVNLSPVQFRHGDLPTLVHTILLETGLAADRLEFEITEGVLIADFTRAVSVLRRLKALGVRIAMDDFGTGYSSLSYLQSFPFDKIKIDQSFISDLEHNRQSAAIVRAVVSLAHGLGLPVIAEGVESSAQLEFLTRETVDEIQGYLLGRPYPIEHYAEAIGHRAGVTKAALVS